MQNDIKGLERNEKELRNVIDHTLKHLPFLVIKIEKNNLIQKGSYNSIYVTQQNLLEGITVMPPLAASINHNPDSIQNQLESKYAAEIMKEVTYSPFIQANLGESEDGGAKFAEKADTDLWKYLKSKRFSITELREMIGQIILAFEHLHLLKIVHRDVKSENILVFLRKTKTELGIRLTPHLKVCDFDTAQKVNSQGKLLRAKTTPKGTVAACSEQIKIIIKEFCKHYDLILMSLTDQEEVSIQNVEENLRKNKQLMGSPILIKVGNSFSLYIPPKQGKGKLIAVLDATQLKVLKFKERGTRILPFFEVPSAVYRVITPHLAHILVDNPAQALRRYHNLNHFLEDFFNVGFTIQTEILCRAQSPKDSAELKPLMPLILQLINQDPTKRLAEAKMVAKYAKDPDQYIKSIYEWIKSNEFFGKDAQTRANFFNTLLIKFTNLDKSFITSGLIAQSRKSAERHEGDVFKLIDSLTDEKQKIETFETYVTSKSEITDLIKNSNCYLSDIMAPITQAWETVKNRYDLIMSTLKKEFVDKDNNPETLSVESLENFNKARQDLSRELKNLSSTQESIFKTFETFLEKITTWLDYAQKLKDHFMITFGALTPPPVPEKLLSISSNSSSFLTPKKPLDPTMTLEGTVTPTESTNKK